MWKFVFRFSTQKYNDQLRADEKVEGVRGERVTYKAGAPESG